MIQRSAPRLRLVALVVTHNRRAELERTLARLLASPPEILHGIVVIDNASNDGTSLALAGNGDPRLSVEIQCKNLGGAGGFARGISLAQERFDLDWLVLMDDDARPEDGALDAFHAAQSQPDETKYDALAAAVYTPDGDICMMNRPKNLPPYAQGAFWRNVLRRGAGAFHLGAHAYAQNAAQPIEAASFVGLFLSRRALALAPLPDAALFIYTDDIIYTLSLTKAGGRIGFAPYVRFEHARSNLPEGRISPLWKAYFYHRNLLRLYRFVVGKWAWLMVPGLFIVWMSRVRLYPRGQKWAYVTLIWYALRGRALSLSEAQSIAAGAKAP